MRPMLWAIVVLVGTVGVVALIGWLLPVAHVASRTTSVAGAPEAVFEVVHNVARYPVWRASVKKVEMLDSRGDTVRFREHSGNGAITMEVVETVAPSRIVTRIADPGQPFGGTWTFEFTPGSSGSTITITEHGEVYNPIFRFMSRFVFGHHRTIDRYLGDLRRHLADVARPAAV